MPPGYRSLPVRGIGLEKPCCLGPISTAITINDEEAQELLNSHILIVHVLTLPVHRFRAHTHGVHAKAYDQRLDRAAVENLNMVHSVPPIANQEYVPTLHLRWKILQKAWLSSTVVEIGIS